MRYYNIKNCPSYDEFLQEPTCNKYPCDCKSKEDCILKKIMEKCQDEVYGDEFSEVSCFARIILNLLDIDEVEE